jgi:hypothetical protein
MTCVPKQRMHGVNTITSLLPLLVQPSCSHHACLDHAVNAWHAFKAEVGPNFTVQYLVHELTQLC